MGIEEDRITSGCNVLLYGVPGSGKSWTIEHEYCKKETNVERLVFHPDYTYSDFIPHEPTRIIHIHPKAIPHPPERTTFMEVQEEPDMIGNYSEM